MDLLAHTLYGATVCSRAGLAGGARGAGGRPWTADWTVWCAALFGMLPDVVSMGVPFLAFVFTGLPGHFFRDFDGPGLTLYRYMHSLLVALAVSGLLRLAWKPLFLPSLAWALHVAMDALTHGAGRFQTPLAYPLTAWGLPGIPWWRHPEVFAAYWLLLPVIWIGLRVWRRTAGRQAPVPDG